MALQSGKLLQNRYLILRQIGGGGMGVVYLAEDTRLSGRQCAIKEISPAQLAPQDRNWAIQAFKQEAQMLARLSHPGLTAVTDFFPEEGNWYLVMEYVVGETLEARLRRAPGGRLPLAEVLNIVRQLCNVLEYLHSQTPPVVFRDLKPGNVMLTPQGEVKLIDFGIARFFKPGQTRDTMLLGTPGYAAPEQYGGLGQCDARTDVYGLGVLLHQMVTGHDPTQAVTPFPLPPVGSLMRGLPEHVERAISQATQVQPEYRFASVVDFRQALFPETRLLPGPPSIVHRSDGTRIGMIVGVAALSFLCVAVSAGILAAIITRDGTATPPLVSVSGTELPPPSVDITAPTEWPSSPVDATSAEVPPPLDTSTPIPSAEPYFNSLQWTNIGQSVQGRAISVGSIGYDDGDVAVIVVGSIQGDQSGTRDLVNALATYFDAHHEAVPAGVMFYLLPSLNPDGNASGSRFNANGVDLNRNWDTADWRSNPAVPGHPNGLAGAGGRFPMSEPENRALRDYIYGLESRFVYVRLVVVHSSERRPEGEVYPGGSNSEDMADEYATSTGYSVETSWADYVTSGELVTWGAEQGLGSLDIVLPASQRPSTQVPGTGRTLTELTVQGLVAIATWR